MNTRNFVMLTGRLTRDPEVRYTDSKKAVCSFTLAVDDGRDSEGKKKAQFIRCVAWDRRAEFLDQYFTKGKPVSVIGRITARAYEKNGEKRDITEIVCDIVDFPLTVREEATTATAFEDLNEDIDLPF